MKKKTYVAPLVEQMEAKVEKGFAGSDAPQTQQLENLSFGTDQSTLFS